MMNGDKMRMKVGLLCLGCENRWEVDIDAKDTDKAVEFHTFCKVCDGEDVIVEYIDHPTLGLINTALEGEVAEDVVDTFAYLCPVCENTYFLTANVPNRCPYCVEDRGIFEAMYQWLRGKLGVKAKLIGTEVQGRLKGDENTQET